jgi:hypothetical protein
MHPTTRLTCPLPPTSTRPTPSPAASTALSSDDARAAAALRAAGWRVPGFGWFGFGWVGVVDCQCPPRAAPALLTHPVWKPRGSWPWAR